MYCCDTPVKKQNIMHNGSIFQFSGPDEEDDLPTISTGSQELPLYSPPVLDPRYILASFKV